MENDAVLQQLEEWKEKYFQSVSSLEKQQNYDEVLQRSLGRLALAAQGLDRNLDTQLKSLRGVLRKKSTQEDVEFVLKKMEQAIGKMESTKTKDETQNAGEILSDLLKSLKLKKPFKSEAKDLAKQFKSASSQQVPPLVPKLLSLLDRCLNDSKDTKSSRGFSFNLFGMSKSSGKDKAHETSEEQQPSSDSNAENQNTSPIHMVLMQLLERLSLPTELSEKATKLRHQIEKGLREEDLPRIINAIADIISSLGSQAVNEKHEYEAFLQDLTSKLNEIDKHIRETGEQDKKAFKQRHILGEKVDQEVSGLRSHVEEAVDLEQLKSTVDERLNFLSEYINHYRKADHTRFEQSQQQIKSLNERLQSLEQETDTLRKTTEKARESALKDALTGIWNRQAMNDILEKEFTRWQRHQKPLSIVIWDVDFFKRVNDSYGHAAGDKVLKTIARIFQQATRNEDFIARFGGEEFVGIFPETNLKDAVVLANKIREKIKTSNFHYENEPVAITASAGLATFQANDSIEDVLKRADAALYEAKDSGRNCCRAKN